MHVGTKTDYGTRTDYYANFFGDGRAEQLTVTRFKNKRESDSLTLKIPEQEDSGTVTVPVDELVRLKEPANVREPDPDKVKVSYKIGDLGTADIDGDGYDDIYVTVTKNYFPKKVVPLPKLWLRRQETQQHVFSPDDLKAVLQGSLPRSVDTPPESADSANSPRDLRWRVSRLETDVRQLDWAMRDVEHNLARVAITIRDHEERLAALEGNAGHDTAVRPGERVGDVESEIALLKEEIENLWGEFDDLQGRVDALED